MKRLLLFASLAAGAAAQDAKPAPVFGPQLPAALYNYARPELPFFYLQPGVANLDNTPSFNLVSDEGATLGRVLFYDTALSRNRTRACGCG